MPLRVQYSITMESFSRIALSITSSIAIYCRQFKGVIFCLRKKHVTILSIDFGTNNLSPCRNRKAGVIVKICIERIFTKKFRQDNSCSTLSVLRNDNLCLIMIVNSTIRTGTNTKILRTVKEYHHISILLDSSRLSKVRQLRPLSLCPITRFHITVQLAQGQHWNVQLLSQSL